MDNAEFMGMYIARSDALKAVFPEEHECGLWQAWRMSNGDYIVQPVDMGRQPCGSLSMMQAEDFIFSLSPMPSDEEIAAVGKRLLRADAPDLLDAWYEQGKDEGYTRQVPQPVSFVAPACDGPQTGTPQFLASRPDAPFAHQPLAASGIQHAAASEVPAPVQGKHADVAPAEAPVAQGGFSVELEDATVSTAQDSFADMLQAVTDTLTREREEQAEGGGLPPLFDEPGQDGAGKSAAPAAESGEGTFYEERAAILENSMREEFAMLLDQLDDSPYPAMEKEVEKLLSRGSSFTWKQKFMFSEFGMALRRKNKAYLALMAHERALGLAPGDGHILFNLARSEYELGDISAAKRYLEQALSVLPDFAPARNFLTFLEGQKDGTRA